MSNRTQPMTFYCGPLVDALMNTLFDIDDYKHGRGLPTELIVIRDVPTPPPQYRVGNRFARRPDPLTEPPKDQ